MLTDWMAWTPETAGFFAAIAGLLAITTLFAALRPELPRVGALGIPTTLGDRLFLSLLGAAFIHLAWLGLAPADAPAWYASVISLAYAAAVFRWV